MINALPQSHFKKIKQMKKLNLSILLISLLIHSSSFAQDDVNLFDYWKYYSDAENTMYKTSCSLAFEQLNNRKNAIASLQSEKDILERQRSVKKKLQELIGQFPEKTPLNAKVTGVIKKKDYRVEKIIFESMPGYYVTAALLVPAKRKGKAPAIIYACGHTDNGFRSETYQHVIINLVKKGFVVLAFDPVGQGERLQYYDEKEDKSPFRATIEHSYAGAQCYISGYSPTKYFIWDAIRCIDYLHTRKEVDPARIGMTGRSGGGTQTAFTAAVDDRILAAAPECFITSMEYVLKSIGPQDGEQNIFHMISEGIDHADLLEVRAPKPTLMVTTTRDFFSIQGARETYREVKNFYEILGSGDQINMVEDDDVHKSTRKNRESMYAFFQEALDLPGSSEDVEVEIFEDQELWATETGQVITSLGGETIYSINKKIVENQTAKLKTQRDKEDFDTHSAMVAKEAKRLSGFDDPNNFGKAVFSGRYANKEYLLEKYLIPGSGDYMLPAAMYIPVETNKNEVILYLNEKGMSRTAKEDSIFIHAMLNQGYTILLFDIPGIGSLGPGYLKGDAFIDHTSFNQWFAGILTSKSLVGMRAEDIIRIANFAHTKFENSKTISAIASGAIGSELLHAAAFDKTIQKVCLIKPFLSFADIALTQNYSPAFIHSTVAGAIEKYDISDLLSVLCPRKVLILNPLASDGSSAKESNISLHLKYPETVYSKNGTMENLQQSSQVSDQDIFNSIIQWVE